MQKIKEENYQDEGSLKESQSNFEKGKKLKE